MNSASVKTKVTALDMAFAIDTRLTVALAYLSQRMAASRHSLQDREGLVWPVGDRRCRQPVESLQPLHLSLLGDLQCIVNFDSEVAHRALQLRMAQEELHYTQVFGSAVAAPRGVEARPPRGGRC
jgi:hypothetical protein